MSPQTLLNVVEGWSIVRRKNRRRLACVSRLADISRNAVACEALAAEATL
jgi:hypothetical protein